MRLTLYQIDAFAAKPFEGNPAAVVPLDEWLPDATMQAIAGENNLAETAFFVPTASGHHIRWFTPADEVKLCGHATLASAFVLFTELGFEGERIDFESASGILTVSRNGATLTLDFPSQKPEPVAAPAELVAGLGQPPDACLAREDYVAVYPDEQTLAALQPDYSVLGRLDRRGVIATAPSREFDFVARFFAPKLGIPEDPVTGSAYTHLAPYWAERLGRNTLSAKQISPRGGCLQCELQGERVLISGSAVKYLEGSFEIST